ncbi:hypothetical protein [Sporosarcina ureae]|uniref:hypothetical protein n=1 Tax=Sporosarcina ureae TaxID=1571 RepID=UPI000A17E6D1|nr:hypothetical protein [Sporosarcina ureae]ARK20618.1 hypothetical protein SporoP32a_03055 [Sporosarcina ureae]
MTDRELLELLVDKVTNIEQDFFGVKTDVSSLKTDVSSLKSDVSTLKSDVSTLKKDVSSIKEEQIFMKQAIFELDARSIVTSHKIDALTEQVSSNTTKLDDLRTTQRLVSDHDTDIRMIKKMLTQ